MSFPRLFAPLVLALACACGRGDDARKSAPGSASAAVEILNVSYDPTRELYD